MQAFGLLSFQVNRVHREQPVPCLCQANHNALSINEGRKKEETKTLLIKETLIVMTHKSMDYCISTDFYKATEVLQVYYLAC